MLIPQRRHERDLKCLIARMRHRWVAASKMPTFSNWALFANAVNKGAPIGRKYLFKSREQSQKYWNKMVYRCSPTPCSPPPHFYTCARLNQTHSCWAESLQFQMCVCLIELLRAISVVTGTLLPLCSSHHVNKTWWDVLNLHPNWVCFATSCYDGHINRSLAAASGSDEVEVRRSRVILSPVAPTQETQDRLYPPQSSTAAQHHNETFSSNKKPITIFKKEHLLLGFQWHSCLQLRPGCLPIPHPELLPAKRFCAHHGCPSSFHHGRALALCTLIIHK